MSKKVKRLFEQLKPSNYDLEIKIDEKEMTFNGQVSITAHKHGRPSNRLTLHQNSLVITEAVVSYSHKKITKTIDIDRINHQASLNEVRLHSSEAMYAGQYHLKLKFKGKITDQMHGIYPCKFKDHGKSKQLIATQFESHHAREAFPCIDEPEAKAIFNLTLITRPDVTVLANTPILKQRKKDDKLISSFEPSPLMSSYLLAFVIGEMHSITAETKSGIKVSSYATIAQPINFLSYANQETIAVLDFFEDYFQTPFPLKKLDNVALPDFEAGAMENWGLITYREVALLTDPDNRSISSEQYVCSVVAHEVSHQWFGNLVTMKWWNDLWLNESFASIMEVLAPDYLHPDWHAWEDFATSRVLSCSHRDIYKDVQAVGMDVNHPDEIMALFDPAIVYAKGARLLCMLKQYIGDEAFQNGLKSYFKKFAYKNTVGDDLWQEFSKASSKDIKSFMAPWINQAGQPLLTVDRTLDYINLAQQRFLVDGEDSESLWPIPLLTREVLPIDILTKQVMKNIFSKKPVIFNASGNGHYIVKYLNVIDRQDLANVITNTSGDSVIRITLLNDMFLLARRGDYSLVDLVDLISHCDHEPRDAVWSMYIRALGQASLLTDGDKQTEVNIKKYKANLSKYYFDKLGWDDKTSDDPNTKHLRITALALSLASDNQLAIDEALNRLSRVKSVADLSAESRGLIAAAAIRHKPESYLEKFKAEYISTTNPDVKQALAQALCAAKQSNDINELIKWGIMPGGAVKHQDIASWFAYLMRSSYAREMVWQWFSGNWDFIDQISGGGKYLDYFVWYASGPLSTKQWLNKYNKIFVPLLSKPGLKRNILIGQSEIEARIKWRKRDETKLVEYFSKV